MAKSRQEKIASYDERIAQLENQRKQEIQRMKSDERKARTRRLCSRHGLLEKFMPDLIAITDEQFEEFIKRGIDTSYGQKILAEIMAKGAVSDTAKTPSGAGQLAEPTTVKTTETTAQSNTVPTAKPPQPQSQNGGNHNADKAKTAPPGNTAPTVKPTQTANRNTAAESAKADGGTMVTG